MSRRSGSSQRKAAASLTNEVLSESQDVPPRRSLRGATKSDSLSPVTPMEGGRSRRSSTAAQTAASVADAHRTRNRTPSLQDAPSSSPGRRTRGSSASGDVLESPATRVKNARRSSSRINYEESEGEEDINTKQKVEEDDYDVDEDVENDSDSVESGKGRRRTKASPKNKSKGRTQSRRKGRNKNQRSDPRRKSTQAGLITEQQLRQDTNATSHSKRGRPRKIIKEVQQNQEVDKSESGITLDSGDTTVAEGATTDASGKRRTRRSSRSSTQTQAVSTDSHRSTRRSSQSAVLEPEVRQRPVRSTRGKPAKEIDEDEDEEEKEEDDDKSSFKDLDYSPPSRGTKRLHSEMAHEAATEGNRNKRARMDENETSETLQKSMLTEGSKDDEAPASLSETLQSKEQDKPEPMEVDQQPSEEVTDEVKSSRSSDISLQAQEKVCSDHSKCDVSEESKVAESSQPESTKIERDSIEGNTNEQSSNMTSTPENKSEDTLKHPKPDCRDEKNKVSSELPTDASCSQRDAVVNSSVGNDEPMPVETDMCLGDSVNATPQCKEADQKPDAEKTNDKDSAAEIMDCNKDVLSKKMNVDLPENELKSAEEKQVDNEHLVQECSSKNNEEQLKMPSEQQSESKAPKSETDVKTDIKHVNLSPSMQKISEPVSHSTSSPVSSGEHPTTEASDCSSKTVPGDSKRTDLGVDIVVNGTDCAPKEGSCEGKTPNDIALLSSTASCDETQKLSGIGALHLESASAQSETLENMKRRYLQNPSLTEENRTLLKDRTYGFVSYQLSKDEALSKENFVCEIKNLNADVICLQEVQKQVLAETIGRDLDALGYKYVDKFWGDDTSSGLVTLYRSSSFKLVDQRVISVDHIIKKDLETSSLNSEDKDAVSQFIPKCGHCLMTRLSTVSSDNIITIVNVNLPLLETSVHALQVSCLTREVVSADGASSPHVICGVFNVQENQAPYQLLRDGYLSNEMIEDLQKRKDVKLPGKDNAALVNLLWKSFQHPSSSLQSCYTAVLGHELHLLCEGEDQKSSTSPYLMWLSSDSLVTVGVLDAPSAELKQPSASSLALKVDIAFK